MHNLKYSDTIATFTINLFTLLVCMLWGEKFYLGVFDDYFMARILEGAYGDSYNVHMVFVNVLYGYVLQPLYYLFPKIGWYYIGEIFAVFISFTTISYVMIKKMGLQWGSIFSTMLIACFARDFYLTVQFTQCAAALGAAGMLLFLYALHSGFSHKKTIFFAFILAIWGYCMRSDAFLMGLPFFVCAMLFFARKVFDFRMRFGLCVLILFCGLWGAKFFNDAHYSAPEYQKFLEFQQHRVMFGDKDNYNKNAVYDEIEEDNLYDEDFSLAQNWIFYDSKIFSTDSAKRITDKIVKYTHPLKWSFLPSKALYRFDCSIVHPCCWAFCLVCLALLWNCCRKSLYVWGGLAVLFAMMSYLMYLMRLVYRVETGLWLYATVCAIPLLKEFRPISRYVFKGVLSSVLLAFAVCIYFTGNYQRSISNGHLQKIPPLEVSRNNYQEVFKYMDSLPDSTVFLMPMWTYWSFARYKDPPYYSAPIGSWKRIICLGFWTPYFPDVENSLRHYGIENPMRDVVKENVVVVSNTDVLLNFLHRHYYEKASVNTIRNIGGVKFFKYSKGEIDD